MYTMYTNASNITPSYTRVIHGMKSPTPMGINNKSIGELKK